MKDPASRDISTPCFPSRKLSGAKDSTIVAYAVELSKIKVPSSVFAISFAQI